VRLPPEVNRAIYVRNLPFNITSEEMYDIFGKYGAIRQIRIGVTKETRGTAFVVYEDIYDAKNAVEHLSGFNVANRYLIVLYYQQAKFTKKIDQQAKFTKKIDQVSAFKGQEIAFPWKWDVFSTNKHRYLIVLYYQQAKFTKKIDQMPHSALYYQQAKFTKKIDQQKKNEEELDKMQKKYGVSGEQK
ncbi:unnamed protein product, partial [Closterium sp. NIES-64]